MTVRIGSIELKGVQELLTEESRNLVEHRVPKLQGSVLQDFGREPVTVVVDGLLFSTEALSGLERLREAQNKAEPLPFAADVVVGTELTEVLIEDVRVRQVAGYPHRYRYTLRLREYKSPPQPANAAVSPVNHRVAADADAWGADSLAATSVLQDPASLSAAMRKNPGLLNHLSAGDLGASIAQNATLLKGADFSVILQTVSKVDPLKALALIQAVRDADSLGDFLQKYADEGLDFIGDLTGVDLSNAGTLIRTLNDGLEFIKKLKEVGQRTEKLLQDIKRFDPLASLKPLLDELQ
ncbi:MAG: hypothetical protein DM484_24075 [Candidatus Methylumidiphilus alinenensis]|uniref:DNA circulation N-terminal domain-containing protein n=1 Tax=Candidatus Methylumidiphilus alinenensis TaxID=2202197 RepID=A0A2W4QKQ6_9GAMM|nr:MAG: hypothetical protein DM484_24075 [Candidatus Methylumidiphilus alinenensis]